MSLRDLNARTRRRLRFHGWLLTLWCVALGMLTSWLMLHAMKFRAPAARYAISAVVMYAFGLVLGTRYWLTHFSASVRAEAGLLGTADAIDRMTFDADTQSDESKRKRIGNKFEWGMDLLDFGSIFDFGEASALVLIPALILIVIGALMLAGYLPVLLTDGVAALLAEMAVQFIFGTLLIRGAVRSRRTTSSLDHDDAFMHIVGKTWIAGVLLVVASAAAGWMLSHVAPGAASVGDLFRGPKH